MSKLSRTGVSVAIILAGLAAVAAVTWRLVIQNVAVPQISTNAMEPQVAELINQAIRIVHQRRDSPDAWGRLAEIFHAHDLYGPAVSAYDKAAELAPESFRWRYLAAHAEKHLNPERSASRFQQALALDSRQDAARIALADILIDLGRLVEARKVLEKVAEYGDYTGLAKLGLARLELLKNDQAAARMRLEEARRETPESGDIHGLLAQVYRRAGEHERAARAEQLAKLHSRSLRPPDQIITAMESLAVNSRAYTERGISLADRGEYQAAERQFRVALELGAQTAIDHSNLASTLLHLGNRAEALAQFKHAMTLGPDNPEVLNNYGLALLQGDSLRQAEKMLMRALAADPNYASAHLNLGVLRERQQDAEGAEEAYLRALEIDAALADGWLNLGSLRARRGDYAAAIDAWEQLRQLRPDDPAAIYNLGLAHRKLGQHARAAALFSKGLKIAPNSSRFVAELAWEQATAPEPEARNGQAALALAERLVSANPSEPRFIDIKAAALAEISAFDAAIKLAEQAAALAPSGSELSEQISARLALYRARQPFRQAKTVNSGS